MKIYHNLNHKQDKPLSVALGYFDGIHKGHKAVISEAVNLKSSQLIPSVFTFQKSPKSIIFNVKEEKITCNEKKIEILEKLDVEILYMIKFEEIRNLSPKEFVKDILKEKLNAKYVICGFNYHFGIDGMGDATELQDLCFKYGIKTKIIKPVLYNKKPISSSRIRKALKEKDYFSADKML